MRFVLLALALLAAGCAEKWTRPGATEADFRAMEATCRDHAARLWPPLLREVMLSPGYFAPPVRQCDARGRCGLYGGWWEPPRFAVVDDNQGRRNQERRTCYLANGWTPVEE